MHFDLTDLKLPVHLATCHSLTRVAEKAHLSLPAAGSRIQNPEEGFGVKLLHRHSQGVPLTPAWCRSASSRRWTTTSST